MAKTLGRTLRRMKSPTIEEIEKERKKFKAKRKIMFEKRLTAVSNRGKHRRSRSRRKGAKVEVSKR